jgi:hypothetical protein
MKHTILISFLIVALLTAGNPAPQFITNNTATTQIITPRTSKTTVTMLPILTGNFDRTMTSNLKSYTGCLASNGLGKRTAPFKIENFGNTKSKVYINGKNKNGNLTIFCQVVVKQGVPVFLELMWGNYVYIVHRGSMSRRGSFFINKSDKATMQVFKDKVRIGPFP